MTDPALATITGHISASQGIVSAGTPVTQPATSIVLRFTPTTPDASGLSTLDPVDAVVDATGAVVSRTTNLPVELWPGSWTVSTFGGSIPGFPFGFTVTAGQVADLYDLRGYTPGPGVSVTTAKLPTDAVGYLHDDGTGVLAWEAATAPPAATTTTEGIVQLAGDLGGTASAPTVTGINGVTLTGVPTAGQVPTATSGTAAAWATPAVDGVNPIITASGYWSRTNQGETNGARAAGTDEVHYTPFALVRPTSVAALGVIVTTYVASTNTGCAIYANASGLPGAMVAGMTTGTLIPTTTGPITNTVSGTLAAGTYWAGVLLGNNTAAYLMAGSFGAYAGLQSGAPRAGAGPACLLQYSASLPSTAAPAGVVDGTGNQYTMLIKEA